MQSNLLRGLQHMNSSKEGYGRELSRLGWRPIITTGYCLLCQVG